MENILIVDDEQSICVLLAEFLQELGYKVSTAGNGHEGFNKFLKWDSFDLVITDINMPFMDGLEMLKNIKSCSPHTVVIVITAHPELDLAINAIRAGAYDFILKPFQLDGVQHVVEKACEKTRLYKENIKLYTQLEIQNKELARYKEQLEERIITTDEKLRESLTELQKTNDTLQLAYLKTIHTLVTMVEMRDEYTKGHSERVTHHALQLGEKLDLSDTDKYIIKHGGYLHDIGKISIPDSILRKSQPLAQEEWFIMKQHPFKGFWMLSELDFLSQLKPVVLYHHERYDGKGYPTGLRGNDIPLTARITAVVDAFDAMTSDRPYRKAMSMGMAVEEVKRESGKQFCPLVAAAFIEYLTEKIL